MPPSSRTSADLQLISRCLLLLLLLLPVSSFARKPPTAPASADPAGTLPDKLIARKAAVELSKSRVELSMQGLRACVSSAPPHEHKVLEADLAPLEKQLAAATWAYNVGNYEDAFRRYAVIERQMRTAQLACDRVRVSIERCSKSVLAAIERIHAWGLKIARIQDATYRAHCEDLLKQSEAALASLEKTCSTTEPAWVAAQIGPIVRPLDEALRKTK